MSIVHGSAKQCPNRQSFGENHRQNKKNQTTTSIYVTTTTHQYT